MPNRICLSLESREAAAPVVALLRRHTQMPISELREAITAGRPILDETPHDLVEFTERLAALLDALEARGIPYRVHVDGTPESPECLRNLLHRWAETRTQRERMTDLESGEPGVETLEWLKREAPTEVFRRTCEQIVAGDGYACDEETVEWARREMGL